MKSKAARANGFAPRFPKFSGRMGWIVSSLGVLAIAVVFRAGEGDRPVVAQNVKQAAPSPATLNGPPPSSRKTPRQLPHDVMALVDGKDISRADLTDACVRRHGKDVLESLVNKHLIMNHCKKRGITVTSEEIAAEVDRMAKRFKLGREQWLKLLEEERGVTAQEYARDIVWPTLALRKLAAADLQVTAPELQKAFERQYGEMVRTRLIAVRDEPTARRLHQQLTANPDRFARLAIEHSQDVNSASIGGLIQPIRRHVGDPQIEKEAFSLQPNQISSIIRVGNQYIILKCEGRLQPNGVSFAQVRDQLEEQIKGEKLRSVSHKLFGQLQSAATVQNIYNDPKLRETMPGVVATVNGDRITMKQLGSECVQRHGNDVLETEISHLLLEQALAAGALAVTDADLEAELRHAAELAGVVDKNGDADLATWVEKATTEQGLSRSQYMRDSVWPSAALKKLTSQDVEVTEQDIHKGFEANYGERVRCQAIVLGDMRRAQEVWDKARTNSSPEFFGDLAAEYSVEPSTKSLRGEVPPIGRHGGQPQLEDVAFGLQPGQLSGIVQVADKFVILRCEGRTERTDVDEANVREILRRDIYEKKLRIAMSQKFAELREKARIDNYLAGTSTSPEPSGQARASDVRQDAAVRPTSGRQR